MEDPELEALRQRRLAEMQANQQQAAAQQQAAEDQRRQMEIQLIQLAQSGRIQGVINDAMLRDILRKVAPAHREITIERR